MMSPAADDALRWLAELGVTPLGPGRWREEFEGKTSEYSNNDLAHEWMFSVMYDDGRTMTERVQLGLGMLDLLDDYWVAASIRMELHEEADFLALYAGYRERLEREHASVQMMLSLRVDDFEDLRTVLIAFAALLGDEVRDLRDRGRLDELADGAAHRRAARVLDCSGTVPWAAKHEVYEALVAVPSLHPALFQALFQSYAVVYGRIDPAAALDLLDRLDLPPETEHLRKLRVVLAAGAHVRDPELWERA